MPLFTISSNTGAAALAGGVQAFTQSKREADDQAVRQDAVRQRLDQQRQVIDNTTEKLLREKEAMGEESAAALSNAKILTGNFDSLEEMQAELANLPARLQGVAINGIKQMFGTPNEEGDVTLEGFLKTLQAGDRSARAKESQRRMGGKMAGVRKLVDDYPSLAPRIQDGIEEFAETGESTILDEVIEETADLESASSKLQTSATSIRNLMQHPTVTAFARPGGTDEAAGWASVLESLSHKDPFNDELIQATTLKAHEAMTSSMVRDQLDQLREREKNNQIMAESFEQQREQQAGVDSGTAFNVEDAQPEIGPQIQDDGPQPFTEGERVQFGETTGPDVKPWDDLNKNEARAANRSIDKLFSELDDHPDIDMDSVPLEFQGIVMSAMMRELHGIALPPEDLMDFRKFRGRGAKERTERIANQDVFERVKGGNRARRVRGLIREVMAETGGSVEEAIGELQQAGYNLEEMVSLVNPGSKIGSWSVEETRDEKSAANQWRDVTGTGVLMVNEELFAVAEALGKDAKNFLEFMVSKPQESGQNLTEGQRKFLEGNRLRLKDQGAPSQGPFDNFARSLLFPLPGNQ